MNIVDKTGRKLKIGATVDVVMLGTFQGKIMAIKEQPLILSPNQQIPPHVVIQIIATPFIHPNNGHVPDVYITGEPDPKDPVVIEAELRGDGKIVKIH